MRYPTETRRRYPDGGTTEDATTNLAPHPHPLLPAAGPLRSSPPNYFSLSDILSPYVLAGEYPYRSRPQRGTTVKGRRHAPRRINPHFPLGLQQEEIFFFFKHVAMRWKAEEEKSFELLSHLDSEASDFFCQMFTDNNDDLLLDERNYYIVKAVILDTLGYKGQPHEVIRLQMDATFDPNRFIESIEKMDSLLA